MGAEDTAASSMTASADLLPPEEAINPKNFKARKFNLDLSIWDELAVLTYRAGLKGGTRVA